MCRNLVFSTVLTFGAAVASSAFSTDLEKPIQIVHEQPVEFDDRMPIQWKGEVNLGRIEGGREYDITLNVRNNSNHAILVDKAQAECDCTTIKVVNPRWDAGGDSKVKLRVKAPKEYREVGFTTRVHIDGEIIGGLNKRMQAHLIVMFQLGGLLNFTQQTYPIVIKEGVNEYQIPLVCTLKNPSLELEVDRGVLMMDAELAGEPDHRFIKFSVSDDQLTAAGEFCTIVVRDNVSKKSDSLQVVFEKPLPVRISPATIVFKPIANQSEDQQQQMYAANAMLRLTQHEDASETGKKAPIFIEASSGDVKYRIDPKFLSDRVARIRLKLDADALEKLEPRGQITWKVMTSQNTHVATSAYRILE